MTAILATNTNNLDNQNAFFSNFFIQPSKQSLITIPLIKYKFSSTEMKTKAICTFTIPRGLSLPLFTMKYFLS